MNYDVLYATLRHDTSALIVITSLVLNVEELLNNNSYSLWRNIYASNFYSLLF